MKIYPNKEGMVTFSLGNTWEVSADHDLGVTSHLYPSDYNTQCCTTSAGFPSEITKIILKVLNRHSGSNGTRQKQP